MVPHWVVLYVYSPGRRQSLTSVYLYSLRLPPQYCGHTTHCQKSHGGLVPDYLTADENPYCYLLHTRFLVLLLLCSVWQRQGPDDKPKFGIKSQLRKINLTDIAQKYLCKNYNSEQERWDATNMHKNTFNQIEYIWK